jgi:succinoglycan biosynthesis transport protein ExoP
MTDRNDLSGVISAVRRQFKLVAAGCLTGLAIGTLILILTTPQYTASTTIVVDNRQMSALRDLREMSSLPESSTLDPERMDSQAEVLRSEQVGLAVVRQLKLWEDPTFNPQLAGASRDLEKNAGDSAGSSELKRDLKVLKAVNANLRVTHIPHTHILKLEYTAPSAARAAEIANAYANAYIHEKLNWRSDATRRAQSWLQEQTDKLRQLSINADLAIQKFVMEKNNNLLSTNGSRMSDQQLSGLTTQLVNERSAVAQAKARYERAKQLIDSGESQIGVTDSLVNPVVNDLRTKFVDASRRKAELERKVGPDHKSVLNLKKSMEEIEKLMSQELRRIAEAYRNDYEVALAREKALTDTLAQQQGVVVSGKGAEAQLRELEQKAQSYKALYENYVQRSQDALNQESFPVTDSYVVSTATPPVDPSHPRKALVLAISFALGTLAGAGAGMYREMRDRVFRTAEQVREAIGAEVIGLLPLIESASSPKDGEEPSAIMRYATDHPRSAYAEALRGFKIAMDEPQHLRGRKVIGVVSVFPNEGKTTIAKNFASLLALQGAKTLLVDADTRKFGLTREMGYERLPAPSSETTLPSLVGEHLKCEKQSGLMILPSANEEDDARFLGGFSSKSLSDMLQGCGGSFDYVVVDLPPIGPVVNARAVAPVVDFYILVVSWGTTPRGAVLDALKRERVIQDKLIGVILNKVDMEKIKQYESLDSEGYYRELYHDYYHATEPTPPARVFGGGGKDLAPTPALLDRSEART